MKQKESEENRVIERSLFLYVESGGPNIDVNFLWAPHYKIRKQDRNDWRADSHLQYDKIFLNWAARFVWTGGILNRI